MRVLLLRFAILAAVLAFWEVAPRIGWIDPELLPPFGELVRTLAELLQDARFVNNALVTLGRILAAFLVAAPLSVLAGLFIAERGYLDRALSPIIQFAIAVPQSIFLPIFMLAFGIGFTQKLMFGATHVVFIVLINTIAAFRSVPPGYLEVARSLGATTRQVYWKFYLPAMLPYLMNGLRLGLILAVHAVLLSEMYAAPNGLGRQIFLWAEAYKTEPMLAGVLLVAICTITLNEALRAVEQRLGRWRMLSILR